MQDFRHHEGINAKVHLMFARIKIHCNHESGFKMEGLIPPWSIDRTTSGLRAGDLGGVWCQTSPPNSLIWPGEARFAAQPWGCSASTSCVIFTACCLMFPGNNWTRLPQYQASVTQRASLPMTNKIPYLISWWKHQQVDWEQRLWQIGQDGKEMDEGAAALLSEAWLVIVPVCLCCQPWQWNMISPSPSSS